MFEKIDQYWRAANYLSLAHIYLKSNVLMKRKLQLSDIKEHFSGHWGTSPGINFIYAHLNNLIIKYKCPIQLVVGMGHAGNALLANLYLEGSCEKYFSGAYNNEEGITNIVNIEEKEKGMRTEINPFYPGTIYDGGELGYSLGVAFGSVLNAKEAITVSIIGDGEMETASLSSAWQCISCMDKHAGHVLPIIHMNNYKMGSRSLISLKSDSDLYNMFLGMGYEVRIVNANHEEMASALEWALDTFNNDKVEKNPLIIFKSPKGWTAPMDDVIKIEQDRHSHKVPISNLKTDRHAFRYLEKWLLSYRPSELFEEDGRIVQSIKENVPPQHLRLGEKRYLEKPLICPDAGKFAVTKKTTNVKNISILKDYLKEVIVKNRTTFKIMSPDELESNQFGELLAFDGSIMEILNENMCQAWMQGYNLTGRHSLMISYEAFMPIISSMVSQYAKYLIQMEQVKWRTLRPSMNYLLTSVCWENTYSHQNPEFINSLIIQKNPYVRVFFPIDGNTLLASIDQSLKSSGKINITVASKHISQQYLSWEEAQKAIHDGYYVLYGEKEEKIDITLAVAGDYCLTEMQHVVSKFQEIFTGIRMRLVAVMDLTKMDSASNQLSDIFKGTSPIVFLFHGYPALIYSLIGEQLTNREIVVLGYQNQSYSSMGLFEKMKVNNCSRIHISLSINEMLYRRGIQSKEEYEKRKQVIDKIF